MKKQKKMLASAKVGDKLYSMEDGWGTVIKVITGSLYPLSIQFECHRIDFTLDGKRWTSSKNATLFWDEIKLEVPKKPLPKLEIDTKVLVWNVEGDIKMKRHFKKFNTNGKIVCFIGGETSWSSKDGYISGWSHWELAEDNTKDEK